MRAWRIHEHGAFDALRLETDVPAPEPGPCQVRVRVRAVGLNHLDLWVRRGVPGHTFPLPIIPGCDTAGEVEALGPGVSRWKKGDRVLVAPGIGCGLCEECVSGRDNLCRSYGIFGETRDGGCAELMAVPDTHVLSTPENLSDEEAASLPLALLTAWHMLTRSAGVKPGQWVLVQAGASGVSAMAIQIARLFGGKVIATVATPAKADRVRALGAHHVLDAADPNLRKEIRRITGEGVHIAVDHVGEATFQASMAALRRGGCIVNCGATTGPKFEIDLRHVFFKNLSILGSTMGGRGEVDEAMRSARDGLIKPAVDRVFPMEELPEAHRHLEERRAVGKVVVKGFGA
jgi:NADPH:quinone reductase-like Zn-dependent oxidoreductase